ncbi:YfhO family protein [candidate division KSB1 bacterium]
MGKKSKKIKDTKKKPVSQKFSLSERIDNVLSVRWIPVLIFIILSIFYFRAEIFEPVVLFSSEGSVVGYGDAGGSFKDFTNPFKETGTWAHRYMGGHPVAQSLVDYTVMFFKNYRATALWVVVLMFLAGLFMFYYMRAMGLKKSTALLIGTAYMFAPMFLSFTKAMHYSKMGVMAFLPLIFFNIEKGMKEGKFRYFLYLGGCIALAICTAHLQYAYFSLLASGLYFIFKLAIGLKNKEQVKSLFVKVVFYCFAVIIGFGLSARCFIPQYFHTSQQSKRAFTVEEGVKQEGVGIEYSASWSLHPEEIASYLLPEFGHFDDYYWGRNIFKINTEYFGSIILLLSLMSLIFVKRDKNLFYFWGIFIVGILFSLGLHTPVFKICYYVIPGMKRLRGPSMSAFLVYFSAMVLAGISLKYLFSDDKENGDKYKYAYIILGGCRFFISSAFSFSAVDYFSLEGNIIFRYFTAESGGFRKKHTSNIKRSPSASH